MLKNKIYKYLSREIFKNFITILLTFTAIAWTVRAVNFLDLMVEDGYSMSIYFKYSVLNITNIITRFIPLAFLVSLTISIIKFERQKELLILWTSGLSKIRVVNIFLLIAFFTTFLQILLSLIVNPFLLNKSRALMSNTETLQINSILKSKFFNDAFKGVTFYFDEKKANNELINIFIKDVGGNLNTTIAESSGSKNSTIIAKKGFINGDKLILFNGIMQNFNQKNKIQNIEFQRTEISLLNISTRTIKQPKIQETSSSILLKCFFNPMGNLNLTNSSNKDYKGEVIATLSRRIGAPLYIILITLIVSLLLIHKKEKKKNFLKKYVLFFSSFIILVLTEIFLKYTGIYMSVAVTYFILPVIVSIIFYNYLIRKIISEKIS